MKEEEDLGMESLAEHYERLLGLDDDWQVLDVELVLEEQRVAIRLELVKKVARMLKRHLDRILSWFRHHISNGMAEGYNSRIQSIKTAARGFRNFANYRTRILFFCGKLNLLRNSTHKNVR
ncbi:MAG: hypothetical protein ACI8QI_000175 [Limisphaerales bacterium]